MGINFRCSMVVWHAAQRAPRLAYKFWKQYNNSIVKYNQKISPSFSNALRFFGFKTRNKRALPVVPIRLMDICTLTDPYEREWGKVWHKSPRYQLANLCRAAHRGSLKDVVKACEMQKPAMDAVRYGVDLAVRSSHTENTQLIIWYLVALTGTTTGLVVGGDVRSKVKAAVRCGYRMFPLVRAHTRVVRHSLYLCKYWETCCNRFRQMVARLLIPASNLRAPCPFCIAEGHESFVTLDPSVTCDWACDARGEAEGCTSGCQKFGDMDGQLCFSCPGCEYMLCEKCIRRRMIV